MDFVVKRVGVYICVCVCARKFTYFGIYYLTWYLHTQALGIPMHTDKREARETHMYMLIRDNDRSQ